MKKISVSLTLLATLFLAACSPAEKSQEDAKVQLTLQVTTDGKVDSKEVTAESGDSVMDVLEEYHKVEEDNGLVTAIDGVSQNAATNTYWMYKVNGQMADKGAEELKVQAGDKIEFYLETFQ